MTTCLCWVRYLFACLCLLACVPVCLSVCLRSIMTMLSTCLSVCLCMSLYVPMCLSVCLRSSVTTLSSSVNSLPLPCRRRWPHWWQASHLRVSRPPPTSEPTQLLFLSGGGQPRQLLCIHCLFSVAQSVENSYNRWILTLSATGSSLRIRQHLVWLFMTLFLVEKVHMVLVLIDSHMLILSQFLWKQSFPQRQPNVLIIITVRRSKVIRQQATSPFYYIPS